jgi:hypothetical protein
MVKDYLKMLWLKYRILAKKRVFVVATIESLMLFTVALVANYFAGVYATSVASNVVTDVVLNNIPTYNVAFFYYYVPIIATVFIGLLCIFEPKRTPFLLKSVALFILIRSVFISLTHLGIPPVSIETHTGLNNALNFGGDLFFSGHTGMPFLMTLIFWHHKYLRIFFFMLALVLGSAMLLGHLHYSIDVLSAFFITYSIFHIAEVIFSTDYKFFIESENL